MTSELNVPLWTELIKMNMNDRSLREVSPDVGVSPSTLSRLLRGQLPDLETFLRVCDWMEVNPATLLLVDGVRVATEYPPAGDPEGPYLLVRLPEDLPSEQHLQLQAAMQQMVNVVWRERKS